MAAVRVPPSACNTSQSTQIVRGPSFSRSTAARMAVVSMATGGFAIESGPSIRWRDANGRVEAGATLKTSGHGQKTNALLRRDCDQKRLLVAAGRDHETPIGAESCPIDFLM